MRGRIEDTLSADAALELKGKRSTVFDEGVVVKWQSI